MDPAECLRLLQQHAAAHSSAEHPCCSNGRCPSGSASAASPGPATTYPPPPPPFGSQPFGQVLDLGDEDEDPSSSGDAGSTEALLQELPELKVLQGPDGKAAEAEAEQDAITRMRGTSSISLIESVLEQHQARITVHRAYEGAFKQLLGKGRAALSLGYPKVVSLATARFAAISVQVRAAASLLNEEGSADAKEASGLIRRLQGLEKKKLTLIAAAHLDRVRFAAATFSGHGPDPGPGSMAVADAAATRKQLAEMDSDIEETVSELRHTLLEVREAQAEDATANA